MKVGQIFRDKLVNRIKGKVEDNANVFLLSFSQLTGAQTSELRKSLKQAGADVYVAKNAIARKALSDLNKPELAESIVGQMAFVWGNADSVEISKILVKHAKEYEQLTVQAGLLENTFLKKEDVQRLADLPSKAVLLATLLGTIQAPVSRLLNALNAKSRDLLSILKQLSEKKGGN